MSDIDLPRRTNRIRIQDFFNRIRIEEKTDPVSGPNPIKIVMFYDHFICCLFHPLTRVKAVLFMMLSKMDVSERVHKKTFYDMSGERMESVCDCHVNIFLYICKNIIGTNKMHILNF